MKENIEEDIMKKLGNPKNVDLTELKLKYKFYKTY